MTSRGKRPSVFERLSDPNNYTGVYFERFRTQNGHINANSSSGNVNNLQEILRPSVRSSTCVHIGKGWDAGQHSNSGFVHDTPATRSNPFVTSTSSFSAIPLKTKEAEDTIRRRMSLSSPSPSCYTPSRSPSSSLFFSSLPPNNERSPPSQTIRRPSSALNSREIVKSLLNNNNQHKIKQRSPSPSLITNLREIHDEEVIQPVFREEREPSERIEKPKKRAATPLAQNPIFTNIEKDDNTQSITNKTKNQKQISVFERLNDKQNFTGVYKERFESGNGSINGSSEYYDNGNNHSSIPEKRAKPRASSAIPSRPSTTDHISVSLNQYQRSPPQPSSEKKKKKKTPPRESPSPKSPNSPDWTNFYRGSYKEIKSKQSRERT